VELRLLLLLSNGAKWVVGGVGWWPEDWDTSGWVDILQAMSYDPMNMVTKLMLH